MRIRRPRGQRKKTCSKCGKPLDRQNQRYCKDCHASDMREYRKRKRAQWEQLISESHK